MSEFIRSLFGDSLSEAVKSPVFIKIIQSFFIMLVFGGVSFMFTSLIGKGVKNSQARYRAVKYVNVFFSVLIIVCIFLIWISMLRSVAIVLSVISVGLALALQSVILSYAGWLYIITRKSVKVGDRIEINGLIGDVIDIDPYSITLLEIGNWVKGEMSTGRIVKLPNSAVFQHHLYNYTHGWDFIWDEISVTITFESDFKKAEAIFLDIIKDYAAKYQEEIKKTIDELGKKYLIYFKFYTPKTFVSIESSGIQVTLRYLVNAREKRMKRDEISREFLLRIGPEPDVNLAYETRRIVKD